VTSEDSPEGAHKSGSYLHQQFLELFFLFASLRLDTISCRCAGYLRINVCVLSGLCISLRGIAAGLWMVWLNLCSELDEIQKTVIDQCNLYFDLMHATCRSQTKSIVLIQPRKRYQRIL